MSWTPAKMLLLADVGEYSFANAVLNLQKQPQTWTLHVSYGVDFMVHFGEKYHIILNNFCFIVVYVVFIEFSILVLLCCHWK